MIDVLIADDHAIVRRGQDAYRRGAGHGGGGEASDGLRGGHVRSRSAGPDVILMTW